MFGIAGVSLACVHSSPTAATPASSHHEIRIVVEQLSMRCDTEPVQQTIRIRVRAKDGSVLASTWTSEDGTATLRFDAPASPPDQIEAAVPRYRRDANGPFNGAVVGIDRSTSYCIILPPGCLR